jgi:hypothetical protein
MVIAGFAWHYNEVAWDQSERDRQLYESAELVARRSKFNIWSAAKPTPPWEFADNGAVSPKTEEAQQTEPAAAPTTVQVNQAKPAVDLRTIALPTIQKIIGNKNSRIYHWPGCPGYTKIAEKNQVPFNTPGEAEAAGYRAAKNCSQ